MITFENVEKRYQNGTVAVRNLNLVIPTGKITAFVGPSGCGKTTSLRMINRLHDPSAGTIRLNGRSITEMNLISLRRSIGYVIQHAGLFPHHTVIRNIASTARLNGVPKRKALQDAHEILERVGLDASFANRYPWQLSGGQQQRVGVARALAGSGDVMLMDEPFSAVDPVVRTQLQNELLRLQADFGKTIIIVTHDIDEALKLADQIAVFQTGGTLAQVASPSELLARPANDFVAEFLGRDRGYRLLAFSDIDGDAKLDRVPTVALGAAPDDVIAAARNGWTLVADDAGRPLGWAEGAMLKAPLRDSDLARNSAVVRRGDNQRVLLDAALSTPNREAVFVDAEGILLGVLPLARLLDLVGGPVPAAGRAAA